MGDLTVAHVSSVQPYIKAGVHALEVQKGSGGGGIPMPDEAAPISSAGILLRDIGRIQRKRKAHIGVLVAVVALSLPERGHGNVGPVRVKCIIFLIEFLLQLIEAFIIMKVPCAVQG